MRLFRIAYWAGPSFEGLFSWYTRQDSVTFGDPETSSLQTSLQEKISLRIATGNSHLRPLSVDSVQILNRPMKKPVIRPTLSLVHPAGFEPTTSCTANRRSIQLSYGCANEKIIPVLRCFCQSLEAHPAANAVHNVLFVVLVRQILGQSLSNPVFVGRIVMNS